MMTTTATQARARSSYPPAVRPYRDVVFIDSKKKALLDLDDAAASVLQPIAVDTEFDVLSGRNDKQIAIWSYSRGRGERKVVLGEFAGSVYADWLCDKRYKKVFSDYKADAPVFGKLGLDLDEAFHADIVHMDFFFDENNKRHGLKDQVQRHLHRRRKGYSELFSYRPADRPKSKPIMLTPSQLMGWVEMPADALAIRSQLAWMKIFLEYSGDDAEDTILLYKKHRMFLEDIGYWPTYVRVDRPFTLVLMRCEERGIPIDKDRMSDIRVMAQQDVLRSAHLFRAQLGVDEELNLNSKQQLRKLLIDELGWPQYEDMRTKKTGEAQISKGAINRWIKEGFRPAAHLLGYNNMTKLVRDITSLLKGVSGDGRLRSSFNQIGASTGRISSRKWTETRAVEKVVRGLARTVMKKVQLGANLQNVVGKGEKDPYGVRGAFIASPGYLLVVADYSGFELCMAIHWASKFRPDSKMLELMVKYGSPSAIHAYTAIKMAHVPLTMDEWQMVKLLYPDQYGKSKNRNFNLLFMGSAAMLAKLSKEDPRDPEVLAVFQKHYDAWYKLYPEIKTCQEEMVKLGYTQGWVPTIGGYRQNVAEGLADPDKWVRRHWERKCMNGPCQGSAAAIVKMAMVLIENDEELKELGYRQLMPIHDEIVGEAPIETADRCLARKVELMKKPYARQLAFGEMVVEAKTGRTWLEAK